MSVLPLSRFAAESVSHEVFSSSPALCAHLFHDDNDGFYVAVYEAGTVPLKPQSHAHRYAPRHPAVDPQNPPACCMSTLFLRVPACLVLLFPARASQLGVGIER